MSNEKDHIVLFYVINEPGLCNKDLAVKTGYPLSTVKVCLRRLEDQGYVCSKKVFFNVYYPGSNAPRVTDILSWLGLLR